MKPLKNGIRLPGYKERSLVTTHIAKPHPPRFVTISIPADRLGSYQICVREKDQVFLGSKIAEPLSEKLPWIHASVSGRVSQISSGAIRIESDEANTFSSDISPHQNLVSNPAAMIDWMREAGVCDMGVEGLPLHVLLNDAKLSGARTLVLNGCESEPFLTSDHVLMLNHPNEILKGVELLKAMSGAVEAVIAIEENKLEAAEVLNTKNYTLKLEHIKVIHLPDFYPQGANRMLGETILGKKLLPGQSLLSAGILVLNIATAYAVYEAVYLGKPAYERVVTVTGPCIAEPKNIWARIGTPISEIIRHAKGLLRDSVRLILGGPMTGNAISDLETPISLSTQGVVALSLEMLAPSEEGACIRCGKCLDVCPVQIDPQMIVAALRAGDFNLAGEYGLGRCIGCGACSSICPAGIQIAKRIREGRLASENIEKQDFEKTKISIGA